MTTTTRLGEGQMSELLHALDTRLADMTGMTTEFAQYQGNMTKLPKSHDAHKLLSHLAGSQGFDTSQKVFLIQNGTHQEMT